MSEEIVVNHGQMGNIADILLKGVAEMDRELDGLESQILKLQQDFTGEAANAYNQAQARWNASIRELAFSLDKSSKFVNESQALMGDADRRGAAGLGG